MSDEPEPEVPSIGVKADSELTEMGIRVWARSKAVNVMVELDLDYPPELFHALIGYFPQIVQDQMERYVDPEDIP